MLSHLSSLYHNLWNKKHVGENHGKASSQKKDYARIESDKDRQGQKEQSKQQKRHRPKTNTELIMEEQRQESKKPGKFENKNNLDYQKLLENVLLDPNQGRPNASRPKIDLGDV